MGNCLVTKLNAIVDNPSLKGLGEIVFEPNTSSEYFAQPLPVIEDRKSEWIAYDANWKKLASGVLTEGNVIIYKNYKYFKITNYYNLKQYGLSQATQNFNFSPASYCLQVSIVDLGWGNKNWDITVNEFAEKSIKHGRDYNIAPTCMVIGNGIAYKKQDGTLVITYNRTEVLVTFISGGYTLTVNNQIVYNSTEQ